MNEQTVTLIHRPYPEIVDDILTAMVGGVVNEPIIFDVKSLAYALAQPAQDVRGITGKAGGEPVSFQKEIDFLFSAGDNAVVWESGGRLPDDESTFYVDYFPANGSSPNGRSPLSDINVGSVTRTLGEAIGREIATVYEQIDLAYKSGFVDTATGTALDLVVAILGITRRTSEHAEGLVTFFRDTAVTGAVTIPVATALTTADGVLFETREQRTLQRAQVRIDVPVRATEASKGPDGVVAAGAINQLLLPMAGISRVSNAEATFLGADDETDEELRARAKAVLRALGKATLAALARVIVEQRGELKEVWDPNGAAANLAPLGTVTLLVDAEPERMAGIRGAVEETRAAGVLATIVARYIYFKPRLLVTITAGLPAAGQAKIVAELIAAMQVYADGLTSGQPAEGAALLEALGDVDDVGDVKFVDVITWRADVGQAGADTLVAALLRAIETAPAGDSAALEAALTQVVTEQSPLLLPTGARIADRSLLQGPDGSPATDTQVEAGEFQVSATVDGEPWWVVLDVESADIVLQEAQ